jgi:hypothetical protein
MADDDRAAIVQVSLAAFSAAKTEIADRSKAQHTLIQLNITAVGTIVGFVLANKADPQLLLLLPLLSPALGMLHLDHGVNISNIGTFIDTVIRAKLAAVALVGDVMGYEEHVRRFERRLVLRFLLFGIPIFLLFAGVPVYCLLFLRIKGTLVATWAMTLWWSGTVLVLAYFWLWLVFILRPFLDQLRR